MTEQNKKKKTGTHPVTRNMVREKLSKQESVGGGNMKSSHEEGKLGNGGSASIAAMKVCKQSGSKEFWECRVWRLTPQNGTRRREQGLNGEKKRGKVEQRNN